MIHCILCGSPETLSLYRERNHRFLECTICSSVFRDPATFLNREEEEKRYLTHNNDVEDPDYRQFVSPLVTAVLKDYPEPITGLDFGAGTGPVIAHMLNEKGFKIELYDPFFHPDTSVLNRPYDLIVCCEVIEHFHRPLKEFKLLHSLLNPGGKLYCMTDPLPKITSFADWYYKEDPTHVIFYSEENLNHIKRAVGFSGVSISNRLITFER